MPLKNIKKIINLLDKKGEITFNQELFNKWYSKAIELWKEGKENSQRQAIKYFERALTLNPKIPYLLNILGNWYLKKGDIVTLTLLKYAYELEPSNEEYGNTYENALFAHAKTKFVIRTLGISKAISMQLLKCIRCGSRDNILTFKYSQSFTHIDYGVFKTVTEGVDSTYVPLCSTCCNVKLGGVYITFKYHMPYVKSLDDKKWIPYETWIFRAFCEA
ncbi:MAG: type IV pilus biogenesis/stability protein PilW [Promethearchaeota archaeon]